MTTREQLSAGATSPSGSGADQLKFKDVGTEVFGKVTSVRLNVPTKRYAPIDAIVEVDDEERGVVAIFATTVQLKRALVEGENPLGRTVAVGDTVFIRFDSEEDLDGGNTLKHFSVNVADGGGTPPQPAAPAPAAAPAATEADMPF